MIGIIREIKMECDKLLCFWVMSLSAYCLPEVCLIVQADFYVINI